MFVQKKTENFLKQIPPIKIKIKILSRFNKKIFCFLHFNRLISSVQRATRECGKCKCACFYVLIIKKKKALFATR